VAVTFLPNAVGRWRFVLTVADASGLTSQDYVNVTVVVVDTTPPAAPLGLTARTGGPGEIRLNWTPNGEPDLAGYFLYRSDLESGPFIRINADPLANASYMDVGLVPGGRYWYIVRAVDRAGNPSVDSVPASALAGLPSPTTFDWNSLRWALVPLSVAASMLILALLARREGRRQKARFSPPVEPVPPPPS
jgi:predicted phage tail protein